MQRSNYVIACFFNKKLSVCMIICRYTNKCSVRAFLNGMLMKK